MRVGVCRPGALPVCPALAAPANPHPPTFDQGLNAQLCVPVGAAEELVAGLAQLELGLEPNLAEVVDAEQLPFEKLLVKERAQARARHRGQQLGCGLLHPP